MAQQREASTDRLVGIIAAIKLERKSGQLRVRRGEGLTSEEGALTFVQGQVTQAHVGRRNGSDALNWLSTWGQAHYTFTSTLAPDGEEGVSLALSESPVSSPERARTDPLPDMRVHTDKLELTPSLPSDREVPYTSAELTEALAGIERAGLSRSHRRLYLLIDGHRSIHDLVPLVGRKAEEVRSMLHDLEWLGIIRIVNLPPPAS
jgi:hypothetical protein